MIANKKQSYLGYLNKIVDEYNNTYQNFISKKPVDTDYLKWQDISSTNLNFQDIFHSKFNDIYNFTLNFKDVLGQFNKNFQFQDILGFQDTLGGLHLFLT